MPNYVEGIAPSPLVGFCWRRDYSFAASRPNAASWGRDQSLVSPRGRRAESKHQKPDNGTRLTTVRAGYMQYTRGGANRVRLRDAWEQLRHGYVPGEMGRALLSKHKNGETYKGDDRLLCQTCREWGAGAA